MPPSIKSSAKRAPRTPARARGCDATGRPKSVTAAAATTNVTPPTAAAAAIVTLGESAHQQLKQMLMQGAFTPGEAIPVRAVSEALGIGATPVREALQRLAAEGVLEGSANMGVRTARLERAELETLYETRMLLEGEAAALAARRITAAELVDIEETFRRVVAAADAGDAAASPGGEHGLSLPHLRGLAPSAARAMHRADVAAHRPCPHGARPQPTTHRTQLFRLLARGPRATAQGAQAARCQGGTRRRAPTVVRGLRRRGAPMTVPSEATRKPAVAVVACGVIGRSWVRVFTRAGHPVRLWDPSRDAMEAALAWHAEEYARDGRPCAEVQLCASIADVVDGVVWVQENGPESLDAKRAIFAALDAAAAPDTILASSTSTLDMTEIARDLAGADRCIVAHPVNPPHVIPAVEVLGGEHTSEATRARTVEMLRAVGQVPVELRRYVPGFLLNRLQVALIREAIALVESGVAGVDEVDSVVRDGLGLRWALMGPFGVANTNADGGVREYLTRFGGSISGLMNDLSPTPALTAALIERLGSATDAMVGDATTAAQRAWRDRMVAQITALKREGGAP
ncbi:MAG: GntR family transcriptional regulator [Gemmatimonadetes bacterium]|nr:GntR family transcriptional regulator [Gemmatimonadota bacterium]